MADENDIVKDESADQVAEAGQGAPTEADEAAMSEAVQETDSPLSDEAQDAASDAQEPSEDDAVPAGQAAEESTGKSAVIVSADADSPSEKKSTGIGDLFAVGILSLILGALLVWPTASGMLAGGESSGTAAGGTAVTVNGTAIGEGEITDYVMKFREQQGLSTDDAWGEWMVQSGYTVDKLRSDTVDYFVQRELLRQAVAENDIAVDESEVDNYISSLTEQVGGEEAFQQALETEGLDIETYRDEIRFSLQQQELAKKVAGDDLKVEDEQILEIAKLYFPDSVDEKAKSLDDIDDETVEQVRSMLESSALQEAFTTWMEEYRANAQIEIAPMPEGLPYAIDLAPYEQAAAQEAEEADETDEGEAAGEPDADAIEVEAEDDDAEIEVVEVEDDAEDSGSSEAADK